VAGRSAKVVIVPVSLIDKTLRAQNRVATSRSGNVAMELGRLM
jgi:hypothetical protein